MGSDWMFFDESHYGLYEQRQGRLHRVAKRSMYEENGVLIAGIPAAENEVKGNYIGTDKDGIFELPNFGNGVNIESARDNIIGGTTDGAGNVIWGNRQDGVRISGSDATGNRVQGNFIGSHNWGNGVHIEDASEDTIGGTKVGAGNVIVGNDDNGVQSFETGTGT